MTSDSSEEGLPPTPRDREMTFAPLSSPSRPRPRAVRASAPSGPALILLALAIGVGFSRGGPAASAEPTAHHLPPPDHVSAETLRELKSRMGRHGNGMSNLVGAVVLLDRPAIARLARNIADEEIVAETSEAQGHEAARPADRSHRQPGHKAGDKSADPALPALALPRGFFAEQDALRVAAQRLALAAGGTDDKALADAFATVTRTCVACHSSYLHGDIVPLPPSGGPIKP